MKKKKRPDETGLSKKLFDNLKKKTVYHRNMSFSNKVNKEKRKQKKSFPHSSAEKKLILRLICFYDQHFKP